MQLYSLLLVLGGSCIGAAGMLLLKQATNAFPFFKLWQSGRFWGGIGTSVFSMFLYFIALRQEELSTLYPFVSTTYLWTTLLAVVFLREKLNGWKIAGLAGIIIGVCFVGLGSF